MLYIAHYIQPSNRRVYNELNHSSNKTQFTSPYLEGVEYGTLDHQALQKNEVSIISLMLLSSI